jgi:hypothetical protein
MSTRRSGPRWIRSLRCRLSGSARRAKITDDGFRAELQAATGIAPAFAIESFVDLEADVRQSILRIARSPFLIHRKARGFIYDVDTHRLSEVTLDSPPETATAG